MSISKFNQFLSLNQDYQVSAMLSSTKSVNGKKTNK